MQKLSLAKLFFFTETKKQVQKIGSVKFLNQNPMQLILILNF